MLNLRDVQLKKVNYICLPDRVCGDGLQVVLTDPATGDPFQDIETNQIKENSEAIAFGGVVVAEGSGGFDHGSPKPFNGFGIAEQSGGSWGNGTGGNAYQDQYETRQPIRNTNLFTHFVLQTEVKLYFWNNQGIHRFTPVEFNIESPGGGPAQNLATIISDNFIPPGAPSNPNAYQPQTGDIAIPNETPTRIRVSGPLNPGIIAPPSVCTELEMVTRISHNRNGVAGTADGVTGRLIPGKDYPQYWAGIWYFQLKFFRVCP